MLRAGLTGGIGCGKSTVATMLRESGIPVVDADPLAQELMAPGGPAHEDVRREFGQGILDAAGKVDREKLAKIAFSDSAKLQRLNALVHPHVQREIERRLGEWARPGGPAVAVVEAALLVEAGYEKLLDRMICVWCRPEQQRERLLARGMSAEQIDLRMKAQLPLEEKRRAATDEIDNSGTLDETRAQVENLAEKLRQLAS